MISHESCRDHLGEFLDQTLDENQRAEVVSHLESCAECAALARELTVIRATLREIEPVAAPSELRRNVRAVLEAERQPRRNFFPSTHKWPRLGMPRFKMSPLTWSGTLALAAFTLMVLARPFVSAPPMVSETSPETATAPSSLRPAPDLKTAPNPDLVSPPSDPAKSDKNKRSARPQPRLTARLTPKTSAKTAEVPTSLRQNRGLNPRRSPVSSLTPSSPTPPVVADSNRTVNRAPQRSIPAPRLATRAPSQEKPQDSLTAPRANAGQKLRTAVPPPASDASRLTLQNAPPSRTTNPPDSKISSGLNGAANSAPRQAPRAIATAPPSEVSTQQNFGIAPQNPNPLILGRAGSAPLTSSANAPFVFSLRSGKVNIAGIARADAFRARADAPAPASSRRDAADATAKTEAAPQTGEAPQTEAAQARAMAPRSSIVQTPESRALQAPQANLTGPATQARDTALPPNTRLFELQVQAPRRVSNAQIRLEPPPEARLFSSLAGVLWSGDLMPETALQISFLLGGTVGGEKISVFLEQKIAGARSRTLQKQILIVPPAP